MSSIEINTGSSLSVSSIEKTLIVSPRNEITVKKESKTLSIEPSTKNVEIAGSATINIEGSLDSQIQELVMQENVLDGQAVTVDGFIASSNTLGHRNKIAGVADQDINAGFSGRVISSGSKSSTSYSFVKGDKIYLNGTTLSTIEPATGFISKLATALNATEILIEINQSIRL